MVKTGTTYLNVKKIKIKLTFRSPDSPPDHVGNRFLPFLQVGTLNKFEGLKQPLVNPLHKVPENFTFLKLTTIPKLFTKCRIGEICWGTSWPS